MKAAGASNDRRTQARSRVFVMTGQASPMAAWRPDRPECPMAFAL